MMLTDSINSYEPLVQVKQFSKKQHKFQVNRPYMLQQKAVQFQSKQAIYVTAKSHTTSK